MRTKLNLMAFATHGHKVLNHKKKFEYYLCKRCNVLFLTNFKPNADYYKLHYGSYYRETQSGFSNILSKLLTNYSNRAKRDLIFKHIKKNGKIRIIDIGSGSGEFLYSLNSKRFTRYGLELDKDLVHEGKKIGLNIEKGEILSKNFNEKKFDVVCLWHVIEHVSDPNLLMRKIRKILAKDGLLVLSTPNSTSLGFKYGKENWFHLDSPRHFFIYSDKTLSILFKRHGFQVLKMRNNFYDFPTDLLWSLRKFTYKYFFYALYPFFKLLDKETTTYICKRV